MTRITVIIFLLACSDSALFAQLRWKNVDASFGPLPKGFHIYKTTDSLNGRPNIAFYAIADLDKEDLRFTVDTSSGRRLSPQQFYEKNGHPLLVVNGTFFSFVTNQNLNVVIKNSRLLAHNVRKVRSATGDTSVYKDEKVIRGAFGIDKKRKPDIAWVRSDSSDRFASSWQSPILNEMTVLNYVRRKSDRWHMETAIGGGPVIVQNGKVMITNEEERMFTGVALFDKHPRTCIGYTKDGKVIIMVIEGRNPGVAEGATLEQEARMLIELGCIEGLNLDGGGSSCMLINGKQTITPSDAHGQRPVPAVMMIDHRP